MKNLSSALMGAMVVVSIFCGANKGQANETRVQDLRHHSEAKLLHPLNQPTAQSILAQASTDSTTPSSPFSQTADFASRAGFYGAVSTDARFATKLTLEPINASISLSPGFGINAAVGYRFKNNLRLEGEFSYGSNNVREARLPSIPGATTTISTTIPLTTAAAFTTPVPIPIPGVGIIPAGSTIPAGVVLNPGPPFTNANPVTVNGIIIPAGTDLSTVPGLTTTGGTTGTTTVTAPDIPAATVKVGGKITTLSGLVNLYYDFPTRSRFEPYVGGGLGVSRASADGLSAGYPGTTIRYDISGGTTVFVYQFMGGVAYKLNANAAATFGYRYFNVAKQSFDVNPVGKLDVGGFGVHNIELGLRYSF